MNTATVYQLNGDEWIPTPHTGEGSTQAEANRNAVRYVPLGYGGHNRSERVLDALVQGQTVKAPLGTYQIRESA